MFSNIKGFLLDNIISNTDRFIYCNNLIVRKLGDNYVEFKISNINALLLTERIIYECTLEEFTYNIHMGCKIDIDNIDIRPLFPYYFIYNDNTPISKVVSFKRYRSEKCNTITIKIEDLISGNFNRNYPIIIEYPDCNALSIALKSLKPHPIIIKFRDTEGFNHKPINELFEDNRLLAYYFYYPDGINARLRYRDKISYFKVCGTSTVEILLKIIRENKIIPSINNVGYSSN